MKSNFFALISRMKYIMRWGLMMNTRPENLSEHTVSVAFIAHGLGVINNKVFGGDIDSDRLATLALYHDVSEIITGDLPTPIKYLNNDIKTTYKNIESDALNLVVSTLPDEMKSEYQGLSDMTPRQKQFIKAADKLSALIKCIEELKIGNTEFSSAEQAQLRDLANMNMPEIQYFLDNFKDGFYLNLDELKIS